MFMPARNKEFELLAAIQAVLNSHFVRAEWYLDVEAPKRTRAVGVFS